MKNIKSLLKSSTGFTLIELMTVIVILGIAFGVLFGTCGGCYNMRGVNQEHANKSAKAYADGLRKDGVDIKPASAGCNKYDQDNDGYVSCPFILNGEPVTYECAAQGIIDSNEGCRQPKINIRAGAQSE